MYQGSVDPEVLREAELTVTEAESVEKDKRRIFLNLFNQKSEIIEQCRLLCISDPPPLFGFLHALQTRQARLSGPFPNEEVNRVYNTRMAALQPQLDAAMDEFYKALLDAKKAQQHLEQLANGNNNMEVGS